MATTGYTFVFSPVFIGCVLLLLCSWAAVCRASCERLTNPEVLKAFNSDTSETYIKHAAYPSFPRSSGSGEPCAWQIIADPGYVVYVFLKMMNVVGSQGAKCQHDYLVMYDGDFRGRGVTNATRPLAAICSMTSKRSVYSTGHAMYIVYRPDQPDVPVTFSLRYSAVLASEAEAIGRIDEEDEAFLIIHKNGTRTYGRPPRTAMTIAGIVGGLIVLLAVVLPIVIVLLSRYCCSCHHHQPYHRQQDQDTNRHNNGNDAASRCGTMCNGGSGGGGGDENSFLTIHSFVSRRREPPSYSSILNKPVSQPPVVSDENLPVENGLPLRPPPTYIEAIQPQAPRINDSRQHRSNSQQPVLEPFGSN